MLPTANLPPSPTTIQRWQKPGTQALDKFVGELGRGNVPAGRERLLALVALAAVTDERLDHLLALVEDPDAQGRSVGELCLAAGLRPGEVLKIVRDTILTVAQVESVVELSYQLPAITRDVASRAQVHYIPCGYCEGTGTVVRDPTKDDPNPSPSVCPKCRGRKETRREADLDRQTLAFDLAKMLPKSGTNIAIQQNVGGGGGKEEGGAAMGDLFSKMVRATDQILHQPPPAAPLPQQPPAVDYQEGADEAEGDDAADGADIVEGTVIVSPVEPPPTA